MGTSAAAPNAAAIAGLVMDAADGLLSRGELSRIFFQTSIAPKADDWDQFWGNGFINALGAGLVARGLQANEVYLEPNPFGDVVVSEYHLSRDSDTDRLVFAFDTAR